MCFSCQIILFNMLMWDLLCGHCLQVATNVQMKTCLAHSLCHSYSYLLVEHIPCIDLTIFALLCQEMLLADNILPPDGNVKWWSIQLSVTIRQLCGKFRSLKRSPGQKAVVPCYASISSIWLASILSSESVGKESRDRVAPWRVFMQVALGCVCAKWSHLCVPIYLLPSNYLQQGTSATTWVPWWHANNHLQHLVLMPWDATGICIGYHWAEGAHPEGPWQLDFGGWGSPGCSASEHVGY